MPRPNVFDIAGLVGRAKAISREESKKRIHRRE